MRHGHLISGAVFAPDGKSIIASDLDSGVHVWEVASGKEIRRLFPTDTRCYGLAVSPDGRTLAVALSDLSVRLCDPASGREFGSLPPHDDRAGVLAFSEDSTRLATGTGRQTVRVWEVATQRLLHEVTFSAYVGKISFSSDGRLVACGTWDGHCRLWDLAQGKQVGQLRNEPEGKYSLYAVFAPHGGPLAVWGYEDRSVRLFDADGVKEIRRLTTAGTARTERRGPWGPLDRMAVSFSPNGKVLAICREVGRLELWDVASGKELHTLACDRAHRPSFLRFSPDGRKLASAGGSSWWGGGHIVQVWDVAPGQELLPFAGHSAPIASIATAPDGATIATAGQDGVVHLWDRRTGKHLLRLEGHPGRRPQVAFSGDGRRVIWWGSYDGDRSLRIWDARTGQAVRRLDLQGRNSFWTAVSDDGQTALSVELGKALRFHDLTTGKVTWEGAEAFHRPVALSPAGDQMVGIDGTLKSVADRRELFPLGRIDENHPSVRFSVDGRRLMAAVAEKTPHRDYRSEPPAEEVTIIDPVAGTELRRFGRRVDGYFPIHAAALSRDGRTVVTAAASGDKPDEQIITLWETETGRERGHFRGHRGQTQALAISADGRVVVSGGDDTAALVWDATRPQTRKVPVRRGVAALDVAARFQELTGPDAEQAYAAMWALISAPEQAVSFLEKQSSLFAKADVQAIQRWIRDLDSDTFAEREQASQELEGVLDEAEAHLKKALASKPSLELRRRIERLLEERRQGPTGRELQTLRVIEILEHLAAPPPGVGSARSHALALLRKLAADAPKVRAAQEAKASLERLKRGSGIRVGW